MPLAELPNIRKMFIPDPHYVIIEADLSGADALVVAKEANDEALIRAVMNGYDIHSDNAEMMWPGFIRLPEKSHERHVKRQQMKSGVHGTNYGAAARTLAATFGWSVDFATRFQQMWFSRHPGIREWHKRTERELFTSRTASNAFGYRIIYFDRIDSLFSQALAWRPQSTVAEVCFRGALALEEKCPFVEMLLQVHDSLVFQIPRDYFHRKRIEEIRSALHVPVPYHPTPLIIPWKLSASLKSWGDCDEQTVRNAA